MSSYPSYSIVSLNYKNIYTIQILEFSELNMMPIHLHSALAGHVVTVGSPSQRIVFSDIS